MMCLDAVRAGPIFGRKTFPAAGGAAEREAVALADSGLTSASFGGFGKLQKNRIRDLSDKRSQISVSYADTVRQGATA